MALLGKILQAALRARSMAPRVVARRERPIGRAVGGCLMRLLLTGLLLFVALASFVFFAMQ